MILYYARTNLSGPADFLLLFRWPGIFESWTLLRCWLQPPEQETYGTYENHTFAGISTPLIVFAITPVTAQPGKAAFHHPTNGERLKSLRIRRPTADLHMPLLLTVLGQPSIVGIVVILVIAKDSLQSWPGLGTQFAHDLLGAHGAPT